MEPKGTPLGGEGRMVFAGGIDGRADAWRLQRGTLDTGLDTGIDMGLDTGLEYAFAHGLEPEFPDHGSRA